MRKRIDDWLTQSFSGQAIEEALAWSKGKGKKGSQAKGVEIELTPEDFRTLLIQPRAVGLIAKSERARGVKDTNTYWTLTPYGDEHVTALRAIPRGEPAAEPPAELIDVEASGI